MQGENILSVTQGIRLFLSTKCEKKVFASPGQLYIDHQGHIPSTTDKRSARYKVILAR